MATKQAIQRQTATYTYFSFCVSNLKMWTVSVLLEAERYRLSILNASEQMLTHLRRQARQHTCTEEMVNTYKSVHRCYEESKLQCMSRLPLDSSSKLKELLSLWDREDTDDCTLRGSEKKGTRCTELQHYYRMQESKSAFPHVENKISCGDDRVMSCTAAELPSLML